MLSGPISARTDAIVEWLRERLAESGAAGFVVGLSGGVDSAVAARLCQMAAPDATIGVVMPCHGEPQDEVDAAALAEHFHLPIVRVDLAPARDALIGQLDTAAAGVPTEQRTASRPAEDPRARVANANLEPRLRMTSLYFLANTLNYLVAGTGNRSELAIGYFTKYGDGGVDLLPIGGLLKSEVVAAARELGVPAAIVDKAPSAGLWPGQTDEAEFGFSYAALESYLTRGPEAVAPALAMRIERLIRRSDHKRVLPPVSETPS
ncbi:MAG TPA: NAD(+) synthase [Vicinamibacterales bacterium]|jgi:NAD+ synthase